MVDSTINLANLFFIAANAVFAATVLAALGRWGWLLFNAMLHRRLTRKQVVELVALTVPLTALAAAIAYWVFALSEIDASLH
ncbi:MAG: hypothetical protein ACTHK7_15005 [Aureliella sp.]